MTDIKQKLMDRLEQVGVHDAIQNASFARALIAILVEQREAMEHNNSHWHHPAEERPVDECVCCMALTATDAKLKAIGVEI